MGQMLSEPVTAKESAYCQNEKYLVGSSCMQGWRVHMEDAHTHILSLPDDPTSSFFGVYDGHGGAGIAQYAGQCLHKILVRRPEYEVNLEQALKMAYLEIDEIMYANENLLNAGGSTALSCLIKDNKLYCANAGDSRMMACVAGNVEELSTDHKPNNRIESERIKKAGGFVKYNRVNGILSLSRALGDFKFKMGAAELTAEEQVITAYPDVEMRVLSDDWEFAVLACDGIWDVMTNLEILCFVRDRIAMGLYPDKICEQLINHCLAPDCRMGGRGSDNMTVILVCFLHDKPYEDLAAKCAILSQDLISANSCPTWLPNIFERDSPETSNGAGVSEEPNDDNDDKNSVVDEESKKLLTDNTKDNCSNDVSEDEHSIAKEKEVIEVVNSTNDDLQCESNQIQSEIVSTEVKATASTKEPEIDLK